MMKPVMSFLMKADADTVHWTPIGFGLLHNFTSQDPEVLWAY